MRFTLTIDDAKLEELMRLTGAPSRSDAIRQAVDECIRLHKVANFLDLAGKFPHVHTEARRTDKIALADAKRRHR
jgi:metal-responsive CopG/Arc/MetJ family transcriptional regulator